MRILIYFLFIGFIISASGCKKNESSSPGNPYLKLKANGVYKNFQACDYWDGGGGSAYAQLDDTSIFISVGCGSTTGYTGFSIKANSSGTYLLNNINVGVYPEHYLTNADHTGTISINFSSNYADGTFSYSAIDTSTGQIVNITEGGFHLPRY